MNKSELKEVYMSFSAQQKADFMHEANLRGGRQYLGEVLEEAYELGAYPERVSEDSAQRVSESAQVVELMAVRGGLL